MTDLLETLGALTLGGSAAIALLALTARISRSRYAARWRCWAWLLLCLRLAIPLSFQGQEEQELQRPIQLPAPTDTVIYTYEPSPSPRPVPTQPVIPTPEQTRPVTPEEEVEIIPPGSGEVPAQQEEITLFQVITVIWLTGVVVMLAWTIASHARFLRWLRRWSTPVTDSTVIQCYNELGDLLGLDIRPGLRRCTGLKAPMLAGLIHPVLLLPEDKMSAQELRYSLLHELTHFKRRDIWLKALALWVNALHWFNPLMWYMTRQVERDTELACDEAALKQLPAQEHGAYGRTILNAVGRLKAAN